MVPSISAFWVAGITGMDHIPGLTSKINDIFTFDVLSLWKLMCILYDFSI
jgi:hypothetical protein